MADFFRPERFTTCRVTADSDVNQGRFPVTIVSRLSVMAAYVAFAFVGAIVIGLL
jgi:hypothetical protein